MMDLVTLVTLCSLGVDPKLMHALVWHQSGGEPWSFTVPGEREPRVYRKLHDAVREANALHTDRPIRVGLAGLVTNASAMTETIFAAPGSDPTAPSPTPSGHPSRRMTRRISTCRRRPGSRRATLCLTYRSRLPPLLLHGRTARPMTTTAPGRARYSRPSRSVPTVRRTPLR